MTWLWNIRLHYEQRETSPVMAPMCLSMSVLLSVSWPPPVSVIIRLAADGCSFPSIFRSSAHVAIIALVPALCFLTSLLTLFS